MLRLWEVQRDVISENTRTRHCQSLYCTKSMMGKTWTHGYYKPLTVFCICVDRQENMTNWKKADFCILLFNDPSVSLFMLNYRSDHIYSCLLTSINYYKSNLKQNTCYKWLNTFSRTLIRHINVIQQHSREADIHITTNTQTWWIIREFLIRHQCFMCLFIHLYPRTKNPHQSHRQRVYFLLISIRTKAHFL